MVFAQGSSSVDKETIPQFTPSSVNLRSTAEGIGRLQQDVLGVPIDVMTWEQATSRIMGWASKNESKTVYICNVNNVVTALKNRRYAELIKASDMATPDGAPIAMILRRSGYKDQERIDGPDLMWKCCSLAAENGISIFLYGSTQKTLDSLRARLQAAFPKLEIAGAIAPPFRPLTAAEDATIVDTINRSGVGIVWVGLGCPKQEIWIDAHHNQVNAVMIGVGAAFDFHAGLLKRAPMWMRRHSLEWFYRLLQDPRRLARRYISTNFYFMVAYAMTGLRTRRVKAISVSPKQ